LCQEYITDDEREARASGDGTVGEYDPLPSPRRNRVQAQLPRRLASGGRAEQDAAVRNMAGRAGGLTARIREITRRPDLSRNVIRSKYF